MTVEEIAKKIYDISLPIAEKCEAPIAYINMIKGSKAIFGDIELYKAFNKVKWNTKLSTSELSFSITEIEPTIIRVLSLSEFEDENGSNLNHNISAQIGTIIS